MTVQMGVLSSSLSVHLYFTSHFAFFCDVTYHSRDAIDINTPKDNQSLRIISEGIAIDRSKCCTIDQIWRDARDSSNP